MNTPTFNTPKTPKMYHNDSKTLDITSMPSIRDKLSAAVLGELVDKSLVSNKGSIDSLNNQNGVFMRNGSIYSLNGISPRKKRKHHERQRSKLYNDIRRNLTNRGTTNHSIS